MKEDLTPLPNASRVPAPGRALLGALFAEYSLRSSDGYPHSPDSRDRVSGRGHDLRRVSRRQEPAPAWSSGPAARPAQARARPARCGESGGEWVCHIHAPNVHLRGGDSGVSRSGPSLRARARRRSRTRAVKAERSLSLRGGRARHPAPPCARNAGLAPLPFRSRQGNRARNSIRLRDLKKKKKKATGIPGHLEARLKCQSSPSPPPAARTHAPHRGAFYDAAAAVRLAASAEGARCDRRRRRRG